MSSVSTAALFAVALLTLLLLGCDRSGGPAPGDSPAEVESLLASGDFTTAERRAKALLRDRPDDPGLRLLLGRIYLGKGDGAAAFSAFNRARQAGASGEELTAGIARSLMLQGRYPDAMRFLDGPAAAGDSSEELLRLRIAARLRVPLASPDHLFRDARELLSLNVPPAVVEALAGEPGVLPRNAEHARRAIAYWSCLQDPAGPTASPVPSGAPAWADLREQGRRVLPVGPGQVLKTPSAAARVARDGDIVEIAAGTYPGDVATWNADGLWLRAVGGQVVLDSGGAVAENMGIWVIRGDNVVVEGIRFTGARSTHRNGSGIRLLARNLWVRRSEFHDNEDGILSFNQPGGEIVIEHSIFTENGAGDGYSHNVYIGGTDRLIFRFNYSAGVRIGHQLKSRAFENYILYNRLSDGADGNSSYTIDLPEGGFALVMGNELQQGPRTVNNHMVSLGAEEPVGREHRFIFAHNTFYNHSSPATFIRDATGTGIALLNNLFAGAPANVDAGNLLRAGNAFAVTGSLADPQGGDFSLLPSAPIIDSGEPLDSIEGVPVVAAFEYVHPAESRPRRPVWRPDPGAHEFCGWPEPQAR